METDKTKKKKKLKKVSDKVVASTLAAGILFGGIFHSPSDSIDAGTSLPASPPAIVEMVYPDLDDGDNGNPDETDEERKRRGGRFASLVNRIPRFLIPFIGAALWAVCWFGLSAVLGVWLSSLPVLLGALLRAVLCSVVTAAALYATAKIAFPNLKAKEIFSKGRVTGGVLAALLIAFSAFFMEKAELPRIAVRLATAAEGAAALLLELLSLRISAKKKASDGEGIPE